MPVIPVDFQVGRSPFAAGDIRAQASPGAMAQPGQALAQAGGEVAGAANQFGERYAQAIRQKQASDLSFDAIGQLQDASFKWSKTPDMAQARDGYNADAQKIRETVLARTSDPEVQTLVSQLINRHSLSLGLDTQREAFRQESSAHRANLDQQTDQISGQLPQASPQTQASLIDAGLAAIKGAGAAGWMTAEQAEQRAEAFRDKAYGGILAHDLRANPQKAIADFNSGKYDDKLSPTQRAHFEPAIGRAQGARLGDQAWSAVGGATGIGPPIGASSGGGGGALGNNWEVQHNNPGGLRRPGVVAGPRAGGFQSFATPEAGLAAIGQNLDAYQDRHGLNTIEGIVTRWAPPSENDTPALIAAMSKIVGVDPKTPIDVHDPATRAKLIEGTIRNEMGGALPPQFGRDVIARVVGGTSSPPVAPLGGQAATPGAPTPLGGPAALTAPVSDATPYGPTPDQVESQALQIQGRADKGEISQDQADAANRRLYARYGQWKARTSGDRKALLAGVSNGIAMLADGRDWTAPTAAINTLLPDRADALNQTIEDARDQGRAKNQIAFASPAELVQIQRDALQALDDPANYARKRSYYQALGKAIAARQTELDKDPAQYVLGQPEIAAAYNKAAQSNDPTDTQVAISASLSEQQRLGVAEGDRRALTKSAAGDIVHSLLTEDMAKLRPAQQLAGLEQKYGDHWNAALRDLTRAGLPPDYQVLGVMTNPDQAAASSDYQAMMASFAQSGTGAAAKLRDMLDPTARRTIDQGLPGAMADLDRTIPDPMRMTVAHDAVRNLAYWYAARGRDPATALKDAYDGIFGRQYDIDGQMRAPKGQMPLIQAAGERVRSTLTPQMLGPIRGEPLLTPQERSDIYSAALPHAFWQTNDMSDGATLMMPLRNGDVAPVLDYLRRPVSFKYRDAIALTQGQPLHPATPPRPFMIPGEIEP